MSRPENTYNRQICQNVKVDLGLNEYGIAYQKPNNPMDFVLSSVRRGVLNGQFLKKTPTGTKLPNPVNQLKTIIDSSPGNSGGNNPPPPRVPPSNNFYETTINTDVTRNNNARREQAQEVKQQLRGKINVSQTPNVLRREALILDLPDIQTVRKEARAKAEVNRNLARIRSVSRVNPGVEESKQPAPSRRERIRELRRQIEAEKINLQDIAERVAKVSKKKEPDTEMQAPKERVRRPTRRRALFDDKKNNNDEEGTERVYNAMQEENVVRAENNVID